jgi:protein TonB
MKYLKFITSNTWNNASGDERLELVFENKNKSYGAYYIRKNQARYQLQAMIITVLLGLILGLGFTALQGKVVVSHEDKSRPSPEVFEFEIQEKISPQTQPQEDQTGAGAQSTSGFYTPIISHVNTEFDGLPNIDLINPGNGDVVDDGQFFGMNNLGQVGIGPLGENPMKDVKDLVIKTEAKFAMGGLSIEQFIQQQFVLPKSCDPSMTVASVQIEFTISNEGKVESLNILDETKSCLAFTNEIISIMNRTIWLPASVNGNKISSKRTIPIILNISQN